MFLVLTPITLALSRLILMRASGLLKAIYIRSSNGDMIQLDNLIELENGIAPPKLYRYNRFVSATISAGLADGKTIGQGLDEMDKIAKETLDDTFRTALSGDSKEYRESSSSLMFAFILAILLIYLILAAQFESFKIGSLEYVLDRHTSPASAERRLLLYERACHGLFLNCL